MQIQRYGLTTASCTPAFPDMESVGGTSVSLTSRPDARSRYRQTPFVAIERCSSVILDVASAEAYEMCPRIHPFTLPENEGETVLESWRNG